MTENLIELIIFPWFFAALVGFIYYQINKLSGYFDEIKLSMSQKNEMLKVVTQTLVDVSTQLKEQEQMLQSLQQKGITQPQVAVTSSKEAIVNNYERAKGLMQRGMSLNRDVMRNCDITEEELELLAETSDAKSVSNDDS